MRILVVVALVSCGGRQPEEVRGKDADLRDPGPTWSATEVTSPAFVPWTCDTGECPWDCSGLGLELSEPGQYNLTLTEDCSLLFEAWGGGGGGAVGLADPGGAGGGGGGGGSLVADLESVVFVGAGGGGAGGAGGDSIAGGGGGGGGYAGARYDLAAGTRLVLTVGGGGDAGCLDTSGNGGAPVGGAGGTCSSEGSFYGGGGGAWSNCGLGGSSVWGGGGGGGGSSTWGGLGGRSGGNACVGVSQFGGQPACSTGSIGGGGGGGGGAGDEVLLGGDGAHGDAGSTAGSAARDGIGAGGRGALGCNATAGSDGFLRLSRTTAVGASCPAGHSSDCSGGCTPDRWLGDGVCDEALDCPAHGADGGDCPSSTIPVEIPAYLQASCPTVTGESTFCLTSTDADDLYLVGMDSGTRCPLPHDLRLGSWDRMNMSFGPPFREVFYCDRDRGVRLDLETGIVREFGMPLYDCDGAIHSDGGVLIESGFQFHRFDDYDDLTGLAVSSIDLDFHASRYTAVGGIAYGAWHVDGEIERVSTGTGALLGEVILNGFDDWIWGIGANDTTLFLSADDDVIAFEVATGNELWRRPGERLYGLSCVSQ